MAGKPLERNAVAQLEAIVEHTGLDVFELYVELGALSKVIEYLGIPHFSRTGFYRWLRQSPEREAAWEEARKAKGHKAADSVSLIAESVDDPAMVNLARLRVDAAKWTAEKFNRAAYDKQPDQNQVNVQVNVGAAWLQALTAEPEKLNP